VTETYVPLADIAQWQGRVDFEKMKSKGIDYMFIEIGIGNNTKLPFTTEYCSKARAAGIKYSHYWFINPMDDSNAKRQGEIAVKRSQDLGLGDLPLMVDFENYEKSNKYTRKYPALYGKDMYFWFDDFINTVEEGLQRTPIIYTSTAAWNKYCRLPDDKYGHKVVAKADGSNLGQNRGPGRCDIIIPYWCLGPYNGGPGWDYLLKPGGSVNLHDSTTWHNLVTEQRDNTLNQLVPKGWTANDGKWAAWQFASNGPRIGREYGAKSYDLDVNLVKQSVLDAWVAGSPLIQPPPSMYNNPYPLLKYGMQSDRVSYAQTKLVANGYSVPITGIFDAATKAAVKQIQADTGLKQTGIITRRLWPELISLI